MGEFLLVTDLDDTLVGDDQMLESLNHLLIHHRQEWGLKIAYITGRSLEAYQQILKANHPLLDPDILVPSVGTEIYYSGSPTPDPVWANHLSQGWDRKLILATLSKIGALILQPEEDQRDFKISYYLTEKDSQSVLSEIKFLLQEQGLSIQIVYSSGKNLDILPRNGDKGQAMAFLRQQLGMAATATVACGDSGNDRAFFANREEKGIIVGNAKSELLEWHHQHPADNRYLAKAYYAGGILEGLEHFGFF